MQITNHVRKRLSQLLVSGCVRKCRTQYIHNYSNEKIGIIGGGMSGIGTLKELKEIGFSDITLFEHDNDIGGTWNYDNDLGGGYKGMFSNSSYTLWPFSDYIYEPQNYGYCSENHAKFTKIENVYEHLKNYTNHFDLYSNIKFNSNVLRVNKNENNKWNVSVESKRNVENYLFDRIVLCLGAFSQPKYPSNIDDIKQRFRGKIYHSRDIKQIDSYGVKDKIVLVVGNSISGPDMVEYAAKNGAKYVYNLYREPRLFLHFWESDTNHTLDTYIAARQIEFDLKQMAVYLDDYGFVTPNIESDFKIGFCKGLEYFCKQGIVKGIRGEIECVINGNDIVANDNMLIENVDIIIYATGYDNCGVYKRILDKCVLDRFYKPDIKKIRSLLYLLTFIAGYETDNVAIVGGNNAISPAIYELQSRLIAQVWCGNIELPSKPEQWKWIQEKLIEFDPHWYIPALACHPYTDDIAQFIGVLPKRNDFPKEYQYIYEQLKVDYAYPAQFRITGPGTDDKIKQNAINQLAKILKIDKRDSELLQAQVSGIKILGNKSY